MVALTYFIYFCIVPLQQVQDRVLIYGEIGSVFAYSYRHFLIVHALAVFSYLSIHFAINKSLKHARPHKEVSHGSTIFFLLLAMGSGIIAIYVQGGLSNVLTGRYDREEAFISQTVPLFVAIQSIATFLYFMASRSRGQLSNLFGKIGLVILLAIVANPFSAPRYLLVGVWAPIFLLWLPRLLKPTLFYLLSLFVLIIAVPLLSLSTRFGALDADRAIEGLTYGSVLTLKNLNVFEMGLETLGYVERNGWRYGDTLLSTVFAHIPREWWPSKPLASNLEVGRDLVGYFRFGNENLAVPWFMDGYMDFGLFGSLLFSVAAGIVLYWLNRSVRTFIDGVDVYSLFFLSSFVILARGTLAVVFSLFLFQVIFLVGSPGTELEFAL